MALTRAVVDPDALRHNCGVLRRQAGRRRLFAVVKSDGYGHGMLEVCAAIREKVDGFCVFELDDGLALRSGGFGHDILVMGPAPSTQAFEKAAASRLWLCVGNETDLAIAASGSFGLERVFVKSDTGMHRLGLKPGDVPGAVSALQAKVGSVALMHHYADAENGAAGQARAMSGLVRQLRLPFTASNTAATFWAEDPGEEFVRCGIGLYGCTPGSHGKSPAAGLGLRPAMSLLSKVVAVQAVGAGECVGYGWRWKALQDTQVAVVACGYGHGYPRHAVDGTPVWANGRAHPLAGRVSMEMLTFECPDEDVGIGDEVELWGDNVPVDEVAQHAGTIGYELVTTLPPKVRVKL